MAESDDAEREANVVDQAEHRRQAERPVAEPEPDVNQDSDQGHDHGDRSAGDQLAGNRGSDNLDAAILDGVSERALDLGDRSLLLLLGRLGRDADEDGIGSAEFLDLDLAEAEPAHFAAKIGKVGGAFLGLHLDQRPALEIDTHVQPDGRDQNERNHGQERRHQPRDRA